jgi:hypothetical protein
LNNSSRREEEFAETIAHLSWLQDDDALNDVNCRFNNGGMKYIQRLHVEEAYHGYQKTCTYRWLAG